MLTPGGDGKASGQYRHLSEAASFRRFLATFADYMTALASEATP